MKKSDLNHLQSEHLNFFNLILEFYGWQDILNVEKSLDRGETVNPEGIRNNSNDHVSLEAQFHAPVHMLSLRVSDHRQKQSIHLFFYYGDSPIHILEWMGKHGDKINLQNLPILLHDYRNVHATNDETILISVAPSEVYELTPVKNS